MIRIITAPIQSGKTTALIQWSEKNKTHGILTPVVDGKRVFMDAFTREQFPMEANDGEETITVGRFVFSKKRFDKAIAIIRENIDKPLPLVIDEIGPLELRGEGFHDVLVELLEKRKENLILVVREGLVEKVKEKFGITAVE